MRFFSEGSTVMAVIPSVRWSALVALLLFLAVLLVTLSTAQAETLPYNIIRYLYTDLNNSNTDVLSGSISVSSSSSVIGTWGPLSPPPTDMTMSFDLTLSNTTDPINYPAASGQRTFLVSTMISSGSIQRDGVTINQDSISLHEIKTSNPVDNGGYLAVEVTNSSGGLVQCQWSPWDGSVGVASIWGHPYSGGPLIRVWDLNANAILGPGPWQIAQIVPEPCTLVLIGIGAISLFAYAWRWRRAS
jgi:hypothetical protein